MAEFRPEDEQSRILRAMDLMRERHPWNNKTRGRWSQFYRSVANECMSLAKEVEAGRTDEPAAPPKQ